MKPTMFTKENVRTGIGKKTEYCQKNHFFVLNSKKQTVMFFFCRRFASWKNSNIPIYSSISKKDIFVFTFER